MTDNKLTDEEIIQRLERCVKRGNRNYDTDIVLDLINRQNAEIERLKECPKCVYEYDGEVMEYCVQGPCSNFKTVEQIKSEAIKEFAEKLKEKSFKTIRNYGLTKDVVEVSTINNLLKEMVDEEK